MKKIVLLYDFLKEPGGLERVMATQAQCLQKKYETILSFAFLEPHGEASKLFQGSNFITHGRFFRDINLRIMLSFLFPRVEHANLYVSHSFICSTIAYRQKLFYRRPYFIYLHHPPLFLHLPSRERRVWSKAAIYRRISFFVGFLGGFLLRPLDKFVVKQADKIFVNSNYTKKRIQKIYGREAIVCYPSLSDRFKLLPEKKVNKLLRKFQLPKVFALSGGRVIPDKRFDWLLEIFSYLKIPLVIVGSVEENYKKNLLQISKKLDVDARFLGFVSFEELIALYNKAEVFCFTSPSEDFGLVPIEAMACGTPVVAWNDNAGPSESVIEGVNGFLARPYDRRDFAEKVKIIFTEGLKKKDHKKILDSIKKFREEIALKPFHDSIEKTFKNRI